MMSDCMRSRIPECYSELVRQELGENEDLR